MIGYRSSTLASTATIPDFFKANPWAWRGLLEALIKRLERSEMFPDHLGTPREGPQTSVVRKGFSTQEVMRRVKPKLRVILAFGRGNKFKTISVAKTDAAVKAGITILPFEFF